MLSDIKFVLVIMAGLIALPFSSAAAQPQSLKMKSGKTFVHKPSGIGLPAEVTGMKRQDGKSYYPGELNISVQYTNAAQTEFLSFYIYRVSAGSASVWFDQARTPIESRAIYGKVTPAASPEILSFPGWSKQSALRVSYDTTGASFKSTGLVLGSANGWMVKVRASSADRDVAGLNSWVDSALQEIGWPEDNGSDAVAHVIEVCADPLTFAENPKRIEEDSMISGLMGSLLGLDPGSKINVTGDEPKVQRPTIWCREKKSTVNGSNVYRADGTADWYLLAISDAGFAMTSGRDDLGSIISTELEDGSKDGGETHGKKVKDAKKSRYYVNLNMPDKRSVYAARNGLPSPATLLKILNSERHVSEVSLTGKGSNITIFTEGDE